MKKTALLVGIILFHVGCSSIQQRDNFSIIGKWTIDRELAMVQILAQDNIDYNNLTADEKKKYLAMMNNEVINYEHYFYPDYTYKLTIESVRYKKDVFEGSYKLTKTNDNKYLLNYTIVKEGKQTESSKFSVIVHDNNSIEMLREDGIVQYYKRIN
jgi:hypothetical protein